MCLYWGSNTAVVLPPFAHLPRRPFLLHSQIWPISGVGHRLYPPVSLSTHLLSSPPTPVCLLVSLPCLPFRLACLLVHFLRLPAHWPSTQIRFFCKPNFSDPPSAHLLHRSGAIFLHTCLLLPHICLPTRFNQQSPSYATYTPTTSTPTQLFCLSYVPTVCHFH